MKNVKKFIYGEISNFLIAFLLNLGSIKILIHNARNKKKYNKKYSKFPNKACQKSVKIHSCHIPRKNKFFFL